MQKEIENISQTLDKAKAALIVAKEEIERLTRQRDDLVKLCEEAHCEGMYTEKDRVAGKIAIVGSAWEASKALQRRDDIIDMKNNREKFKHPQRTWWDLCDKHGEQDSRKILANSLRAFAAQVEKGGYPDVFGCKVMAGDHPCQKDFIETVSVTLSHPWPG